MNVLHMFESLQWKNASTLDLKVLQSLINSRKSIMWLSTSTYIPKIQLHLPLDLY